MIEEVVTVTPKNVQEHALFCVKDVKSAAFAAKKKWFVERFAEGLQLQIIVDQAGKQQAYIESLPAEYAWRPVEAPNYLFIQCMFVYAKKDREQGMGSRLVNLAIDHAKEFGMDGVCTMTSKGSWMAGRELFEKNGFRQVDKRGRFELMVRNFESDTEGVKLIDWTADHKKYTGWHLVYADQCPWHNKSVTDLQEVAKEKGFTIKITKLESAKEAKAAPSGFGVFSLLHDGELLEDHYISATRFKNIVKKQLGI